MPVSFVEDITGITNFGAYLSTLLELDAFILNEDRHTNNIAVIRNEKNRTFRLCPIFDNGLAFLSDLNDYPLDKDIYTCIAAVTAKPFSRDFLDQSEAACRLYGSQLKFSFTHNELNRFLNGLGEYYDAAAIERVHSVIREQMRKFSYLF